MNPVPPTDAPRGRRPALLTVDDDLGVREAYALLFDEGMDVLGVESASSALVTVRERRFDAILLDVRMPQMGGLEAFEALRAAQPGVPIIFVTAIDNTETVVQAMRLGAFDYVTKPFSLEHITAVVNRAVASTAGVVCVVGREIGVAAAAAVLASVRAGMPATVSPATTVLRTVRAEGEPFAELYGRIAPAAPAISELVARVATHLGRHYARVNVEDLAEVVELSPDHLSRVLRDETTMTAKEYVTRVRIEVARYLLRGTPDTLEVIAELVGLWDASHLTRVFRQHVGMTPGAFRA